MINKELERRLEATETCFLRKIMNISWKEKIENEEVFRKAKVFPSLINTIGKKEMQLDGQIYRKGNLEK